LFGKPEKKVGCLGGQFLGILKDMNFGLSSHINDDERGCRTASGGKSISLGQDQANLRWRGDKTQTEESGAGPVQDECLQPALFMTVRREIVESPTQRGKHSHEEPRRTGNSTSRD
jgi:hypothetical protein